MNMKKRRGLQIDSESEESEVKQEESSDSSEVDRKNKHKKHSSDNEDESEDEKHKKKIQEKQKQKELEKRKQQQNNLSPQKNSKLTKSDRKDLLESLSNQKQPHSQQKRSFDEISDLFQPDETNDFSEINKIKEELEEEQRQKEEREQRRRERKEREKEEKEERERERRERDKREKEKRQQRQRERDSKPSPVKKSNNDTYRSSNDGTISKHDALVYQVLVRWWYCMPDWPPAHYDYSEVLEEKKLKVFEMNKFRKAPKVDSQGYTKAYQLQGFDGCFKDADDNFLDLRPQEGKPSFLNLQKKSDSELKKMLVTALTEQIRQLEGYLEESENTDKTQLNELNRLLQKYNR